MRVPPAEKLKEVPKMVHVNFTEDVVTCIASKLSGKAGALGAEAVDMRNWIIRFGVCQSISGSLLSSWLTGWLPPPPPLWATYCALMACHLVALDKRPGGDLVGIWETLCRALDKLVIRSAGDQAKMACGTLQLCSCLKAGI